MDPAELTAVLLGTCEALEALKAHYPSVHTELLGEGYAQAGPNLVGRCQSDATLFLEIDHRRGLVTAWVWDLKGSKFLGVTYEVRGPMGPAVSKARHLVESAYAQDRLSESLPRYHEQFKEQVFVD